MSEIKLGVEQKDQPPFKLDVLGASERIIPILLRITVLDSKASLDEQTIIAAFGELINSFWRNLPKETCNNFLAQSKGYRIERRRLVGEDIGAQSEEIQVIESVILGPNAFRGSTGAKIESSLIVGPNAVRGSNITPLFIPNRPPPKIPKDTYKISINNSIIYGAGAVSNVKGEIIKSSIIAGPSCLTDTNVKIFNSWVINDNGATFIADQTRGHPERY